MRANVLVFSGLDPSGGAGMAADLLAIAAQGAHGLPIVTALTVQDNNRVFDVAPVAPGLLARQAAALTATLQVHAVKIGIVGSAANAQAIAQVVRALRAQDPGLPVVLDPVLASGRGDALGVDDACAALAPLLALASVVLPNLREAELLDTAQCEHVLLTDGHGIGPQVHNRWYRNEPLLGSAAGPGHAWSWPRLEGEFHGSGCTLAAALAARLALGESLGVALERAQAYTHEALADAFSIGPGQRIPQRTQGFFHSS